MAGCDGFVLLDPVLRPRLVARAGLTVIASLVDLSPEVVFVASSDGFDLRPPSALAPLLPFYLRELLRCSWPLLRRLWFLSV